MMLALAALAAAGLAADGPADGPATTVEVVRRGEEWTADYRFSKPSPVWAFEDSILAREGKTSWRSESWTVLTPGVRLERRGWYDILVADKGNVPDRVTIRFKPFVRDIEASYDAALAFTDGSVALYDGKFEVFPAPSVLDVEKFPVDPAGVPGVDEPMRVRMRDASGPVLLHGRRSPVASLESSGTYVLFGGANPIESDGLSTIIDPGLPKWLGSFLGQSIPAVLDSYAQKMGAAPGDKPLLMVSWAGPTPGMRSMGGSVLPSTIVMTFEGDAVTEENAAMRNAARWFAAHEGAHFWLGQAIHYSGPQESWITEGGADLLAYRAVAATDPGFDVRGALQQALDQCIAFSREGGVASANERGAHKAYYHCGAMFGLVAERASGGDFAGFVRGLIDSNRGDREITRAEWLAALDARAPGKGLSVAIAGILDQPAGPRQWTALLAKAGVPHRLDSNGMPHLQ